MLGAMARFEKEERLIMQVKKLYSVVAVMAVAAVIGALLLVRCGVPREALMLARTEAALVTDPSADDTEVRTKLIAQDQAWSQLATMVDQREPGGIVVNAEFVELVKQVAALAKRQRQLIEQQQDDPAFNRQALERFEMLWKDAEKYLAK